MDVREDYLKFLRGELDPFIFEKKIYTLTGKELDVQTEDSDDFNLDEI